MKQEKRREIVIAGFREKVNSEPPDNEDCCMLCFKGTKCYCITCDKPIFNFCSKFEGNEETSGWQAEKRVVVRKPADRNDRFYYILVTARGMLRSTTLELN